MIIDISNYGRVESEIKIDCEQFFPTTKTRAKQLFKYISQDHTHDFTELLEWFLYKRYLLTLEIEKTNASIEEHKRLWFIDGEWYGDWVKNEKIFKNYQKEIKNIEKEIETWEFYANELKKIKGLS